VRVRLLQGHLGADADQAVELALAHVLLRRASRGEAGATLRVYRPAARAVAFGRRDTRLPGFAGAVDASREAGFEPVVRASGGRAVAYTSASVVVDHVSPDQHSPAGIDERFARFGGLFADLLRGLGVDARVGEVPGEYCPGSQSVNARGAVKLVGTAQRMVRDAWLFSSVVVVDDSSLVRPLLTMVYDALGLPFDPASVGSVRDERPSATAERVEQAVVAAYSSEYRLEPAELDPEAVRDARALADDHRAARRPPRASGPGRVSAAG
jgi:lipoate-protein ligase A